MIRYVKSGGVETITEVCEHCGEVARTLHVSDITAKSEKWTGEIKMKDASNADFTLKTKKQRIAEVTESFIRKGLLDEVEAAEQRQGLKYGLRAESMCSESIDTVNNVTQSFCYRTDNRKFLAKEISGVSLSASFHASSEITANITGSKVGVDRKGNIIRMQSYKKIDMETGIADVDANVKYKGPQETSWFRALRSTDQQYLIEGARAVNAFVRRYGEELENFKVVSRFRSRTEFVTAVNLDGGRLR
jgi:hypothetical protein|tara:strand:- start:945 stop:1685 length:741 start_codon:yes stop_codon:yes gene_type:complete